MNTEQPAAAVRHTFFEDSYAFLTGCSLVVLGLVWLKSAGLVTGGMAGLALLLSNILPLPPGVLFTLLNIPFFVLARRTMGRASMVKAIAANLLISGFALAAPMAFRIEDVNGLFAALFGGTVIGVGILVLARHRVGVGGLGILALALQKSRGWNAGRTQLIGDALIVSAALPVLNMGPKQFAISVLSAAAVAGVLIVFHKPGRYTGY
ncbi:YitT family protein [Sphingosinicella rhizophila]|uniref:YitT family protein n=1 Tax=Sphingosinicella rhizophila TaxID=3050082 RepID=A0ABU3QC03_9SPHN|nr:YitT family protein [Sphingosinicella sp. GR2756]MDT9600867.1 YitT family protein [Sphingosinicella sp. GR2756]